MTAHPDRLMSVDRVSGTGGHMWARPGQGVAAADGGRGLARFCRGSAPGSFDVGGACEWLLFAAQSLGGAADARRSVCNPGQPTTTTGRALWPPPPPPRCPPSTARLRVPGSVSATVSTPVRCARRCHRYSSSRRTCSRRVWGLGSPASRVREVPAKCCPSVRSWPRRCRDGCRDRIVPRLPFSAVPQRGVWYLGSAWFFRPGGWPGGDDRRCV
jgi:hypothetical protein